MSGAQPMSAANALAVANASPKAPTFGGYGTTHVIFEPLEFMARLAALVPRPRANLTRFHGVFVGVPHQPNSKHRALITPAKRGKGNKHQINGDERSPVEQHAAMTGFCSWTPDRCKPGIPAIHGNNMGTPKVGPMRGRLKRVFTKSRRF